MKILKKIFNNTETFEQTVDSQAPILKNPINFSLEQIVYSIVLPDKFSQIQETLKELSKKNNVTLLDLDNFTKSIHPVINECEFSFEEIKKKHQELLSIKKSITYLETIITSTQRLRAKFIDEERRELPDTLHTYETYLNSQIPKKIIELNSLLNTLGQNSSQLNISSELQSHINLFLDSFSSIYLSQDALITQVENMQKEAQVLKDEINKFAQTLSRVKAMGNAAMSQYYESLTQSQQELNIKREAFLNEENKLNEYIQILNKSSLQSIEAFDKYTNPISDELSKTISLIKAAHKDILDEDLSLDSINQSKKNIELLLSLKHELEECKNLHSKFTN